VEIPKRLLAQGVFDAQNLVIVPHGKLGALSSAELTKIEDTVRLWLDLN